MAGLSDEEVFGATSTPPSSKGLSDEEVFGSAPKSGLSDAEVFGTPEGRSFGGHMAEAAVKGLPVVGPVLNAMQAGGDYSTEAVKGVLGGAKGSVATSLKGEAVNKSLPQLPGESDAEYYLRLDEDRQRLSKIPVQTDPLYQAGAWIDKALPILNPAAGFENSWTRKIAEGVGSVGANIGVAAALGPGAAAKFAVTQGQGEAVDNAIRAGATPEQQRQAGYLGGGPGATDLVDALLPTFGSTGKALGFVYRVGKRAVQGAFAEGGQEGIQQLIQNAIAKGVYDPNKDIFADVPESALIGAIVGGGVSAGLGGHGTHAEPGGAPTDVTQSPVGGTLPDAAQLGEAFNVLRGTPLEIPAANAVVSRMLPQQAPLTATPVGIGGGEGGGQVSVEGPAQPSAQPLAATSPETKAAYDAGFARQELPVGAPLDQQEAWRLGAQDRTTQDLKTASPPPDKLRGFVDTRGQGRRFMGAGTEVSLQTEGHRGSPVAIYGTSVTYTTDGVDIAHGYANRRGAIQPTVYEVIEKRPTRLLDMQAPITPEVRAQLDTMLNDPQTADLVGAGLKQNPKSLRDFYDEVRDYAAGEQVPANDVQDLVFNPLNHFIAANGYDGMTHIGGQRTKYPEHKVTIYFPERDAIELRRMDAKELEDLRKKPDGSPTSEQFFRVTQPYRRLLASPDIPSFIRVADELGIDRNSPQFAEVLGEWSQSRRDSGATEVGSVLEPIGSFAEAPRVSYSLGTNPVELDYNPSIVYIPNKSIVDRAGFFGPPVHMATYEDGSPLMMRPIHSATLRDVLSDIAPAPEDGDVHAFVFDAMRLRLQELVGDTPYHIIMAKDMENFGGGTLGVTITPTTPGLPVRVAVLADLVHDARQFAHVVIHESTHVATGKILRTDALMREQATLLVEAAHTQLGDLNGVEFMGIKAKYIFSTPDEFLSEAFSNPEFQHVLSNMRVPQDLAQKLHLKGKPTLWQAFVQWVRRVLRLESNLETYSMLEASLRIGSRIIDAQARLPGDRKRPDNAPYVQGIKENARAVQQDGGSNELPAVGFQPEVMGIRAAVAAAVGKPSVQVKMNLAAYAGHADRMNQLYKYTAGLDQVTRSNPNFIPLVNYKERVVTSHREETTLQDAGVTVGKKWLQLGQEGDRLAGLINDLHYMEYLSSAEQANKVVRQPTPQEFNALVAKHKLTSKGLDVFNKVKLFIDGMNHINEQAAIERIQRKVQDPIQRAKQINELMSQMRELEKRPYFPIGNFGRHFILANDPTGALVHFERVERRGFKRAKAVQAQAAKELASDWQRQYGRAPAMGKDIVIGVLPEHVSPLIGLPGVMLNGIADVMQLTEHQINAANWLQLAEATGSAPILKSSAQRRHYLPGYGNEVAGHALDMRRAFASYAFFSARYYARLKHLDGLKQHAAEARQAGLRDVKASQIADFIEDHLQKNILDARGDFGHFRGAIFLWAMGFVPSAATQNLSQIPIVTTSFLASKFGPLSASRQIVTHAFNLKNLYKRSHYDENNKNQAFFERAISYGIKTGRITETQAPQLVGMAQNGLLSGIGGNRGTRAWMRFLDGASYMFEHAEQYNRRVTFRAALELGLKYPNTKYINEAVREHPDEYRELQKKWGDAQARAIITAINAVDQTQYIYAKWGRPKIFRGPIGATLFVFKNFLRSTLYMLGHNPKAALYYIFIMGLLGGLGGLPLEEDLAGLIKAVGKQFFGKDWDVERFLRKHIIELTNGTIPPDLILHGTARYGFGVPALLDLLGSFATGTPGRGLALPRTGTDPKTGLPFKEGFAQNVPFPVFDRSKAISMGKVLPVDMGVLFGGGDVNRNLAQSAQQASGAVFSVGFNMYKALFDEHLSWGDPKRWERAVPRMLSNMTKTWRAFNEGRERTRGGPGGGTTVVPYDVRDPEQMMEVLGMLGGYRAAREAARWDLTIAKKEVEEFYKLHRTGLLEAMGEAHAGGRQEEIDSALNAIRKFNDELPDEQRGWAISGDTINSSLHARARGRALREIGLPATRGAVGGALATEKLFPESTIDVRRR